MLNNSEADHMIWIPDVKRADECTHPDEEGLVSQSVASLRQVLDGDSVGTVAGWVVHAVLLEGTQEAHQAAMSVDTGISL